MDLKKFKFALIENLLLNGLIFVMFFQMNPLKESFLEMNIHPLLLVVSATALRYGNYIGIFSALIASITYMICYHLLGRDFFLFLVDFHYYKFLLMFFLAAIVFGRFKDNYDFKMKNRDLEYELLQKNNEALLSEYEKLTFIKEELRKQIIGAEYSITSLYEIASSLETLDSEDIYTEIIHIFSKFLKVKTMSIYTVDGEGKHLRLKLKKGEHKIIPSSLITDEHGCFKRALEQKTVVKVNTFCKNNSCSCPLMIGPILKEDKVIAIINIDHMDFERVTEYSFNLFKVIIDWINKALVQALEVEGELNKERFHEGTNLMKYHFFEERLNEEIERRERYDLDFSLMKFINNSLSIEELDLLLRNTMRTVDVAAYDHHKKDLYVLLPATNIEQSHLVQKRILNGSNNHLELIDDEIK